MNPRWQIPIIVEVGNHVGRCRSLCIFAGGPYNAPMHSATRRTVLLVQLPIPPLSPAPIRGNVPLAAGYLKLYAEQHGLGTHYDINIFPAAQANSFGD